jgi:hypothetical protein
VVEFHIDAAVQRFAFDLVRHHWRNERAGLRAPQETELLHNLCLQSGASTCDPGDRARSAAADNKKVNVAKNRERGRGELREWKHAMKNEVLSICDY